MTKIRILSDLHLEGFKYFYEPKGEDILILAGDIDTKNRHEMFISWIDPSIEIIMVAGNHEYYNGEFHDVNNYLKGLEKTFKNFHFLNNESIEINGISFFGGTMWSDYNLYGPSESWFGRQDAKRYIRDYEVTSIKEDGLIRQWTIEDHLKEYEKFNREFDRWVKDAEGKPRVCVSHFLPSEKSVCQKFKGSMLNTYFASNNEDRVQLVDYWFHGHTHSSCDYLIDESRVFCNPRGYGNENINGFNDNLIVKVYND